MAISSHDPSKPQRFSASLTFFPNLCGHSSVMKPSSPPTPGPQDGAPDPLTLRSWGSVLPPSFEDGPENIIAGRSDLKDRCIFLRSEGQETGLQTGQRGRGRVLRLCGCLGCPPHLPEAPLQRAGWRPCWGVGVVRPSLWTGCPCVPSRTPPCLCQSLVGVFLSLGAMDPPAGWQGTAEGAGVHKPPSGL